MIRVTRLNGKEFYVNPDLIEFIEKTPDTVLSLTTGKKIIVKEDVMEIILRIADFRRLYLQPEVKYPDGQAADQKLFNQEG